MQHNHDENIKSVKSDFANHVAKIKYFGENGDLFTEIIWKHPDHHYSEIRYVFRYGFLLVYGDLGEASYQWYPSVSPEFVADCTLDYMMEKCQASEKGRNFKEFSSEEAEKYLRWYLNYEAECGTKESHYEPISFEEVLKEYNIVEVDIGYAGEHEHAFVQFCYDTFIDFEGYDGGHIYSIRAYHHWIGIKMAVEQLKEEGLLPKPAMAAT